MDEALTMSLAAAAVAMGAYPEEAWALAVEVAAGEGDAQSKFLTISDRSIRMAWKLR